MDKNKFIRAKGTKESSTRSGHEHCHVTLQLGASSFDHADLNYRLASVLAAYDSVSTSRTSYCQQHVVPRCSAFGGMSSA